MVFIFYCCGSVRFVFPRYGSHCVLGWQHLFKDMTMYSQTLVAKLTDEGVVISVSYILPVCWRVQLHLAKSRHKWVGEQWKQWVSDLSQARFSKCLVIWVASSRSTTWDALERSDFQQVLSVHPLKIWGPNTNAPQITSHSKSWPTHLFLKSKLD